MFQMSFPKISSISPIRMTKPMICPVSKAFSLGFRPEIISYNRNITWPPSSAGMGNTFKKASHTENMAIKLQKKVQSQVSGMISTIPMGPLTVL